MTFSTSFRVPAVWSTVPVITLGLLLVTFAVLKAPWPPDPSLSVGGQTVSHLGRTLGKQPNTSTQFTNLRGRTEAWYVRRVFDGLMYALLASGYAATALLIWYEHPHILAVLGGIGFIGVCYGAWLGLYLEPILTVGGFSLILFGAGLGWASHKNRI